MWRVRKKYSQCLLCPLCAALKCPVHSHYEICATPCPVSCKSLVSPKSCQAFCEESCACDEGYILSGDSCVPFSQCGCLYKDRYYRIGQVFYPNGQCQEECKCKQDGEVMDAKVDTLTSLII